LRLSGRARSVDFGDDTLVVDLEDGRQIAVPLAWFPRLANATLAQRTRWELIGRGIGIHWPDIDEDISVENLLGADGELLMCRPPDEAPEADAEALQWLSPADRPGPAPGDPSPPTGLSRC
jgi:hypothetical protein